MKGFDREDQFLSLCGLNCGLCPMQIDGYCPGCGGGAGNQSCAIAKCSFEHDEVAYCSRCRAYPCDRYQELDAYDSFITHRNRLQDLQKAARIGIDAYRSEQEEKVKILRELLAHYNDGRRKTFFCVAVNLLDLEELKVVKKQLTTWEEGSSTQERAKYAVRLLQDAADRRAISLKLRKKPKQKA